MGNYCSVSQRGKVSIAATNILQRRKQTNNQAKEVRRKGTKTTQVFKRPLRLCIPI